MPIGQKPNKLMWELTRTGSGGNGLPVAARLGRNELNTQEALAVCRQLPALEIREVEFTGGEPLLRPDWWTIHACLAEMGIATRLRTKGLILERDILKRIRETGITSLSIGLDGLATTHDRLRGQIGHFKLVMAGIKRSAGLGIAVEVLTVVNTHNINELPALLALLEAIGVDQWQLDAVQPNTQRVARDLQMAPENYERLKRFVHESTSKANGNEFHVSLTCNLGGILAKAASNGSRWDGCPAGRGICGITSDGKVKGCLCLPDNFIEGDLRQSDLAQIWFSPTSFSYARQTRQPEGLTACIATGLPSACRA